MSNIKNVKFRDILLVDDSPSDADLALESLAVSNVFSKLHKSERWGVSNNFLSQESLYVGVPRPDLIPLDFNLPKKSGWEVLAEIHSAPKLQHFRLL